jgi:hypothetical protein
MSGAAAGDTGGVLLAGRVRKNRRRDLLNFRSRSRTHPAFEARLRRGRQPLAYDVSPSFGTRTAAFVSGKIATTSVPPFPELISQRPPNSLTLSRIP